MSIDAIDISSDETAASQLTRKLREAIVRLDLLPGARLSEQEIAARYGVSRQPAREALISLANAKLVEVRPNRGTVVVPISVRRTLETIYVRSAIERAIVRRACERFDPWVRDRLGDYIALQTRAMEAGDYLSFQRADADFHVGIALGAGFQYIRATIANLKAHMDRACNLSLRDTTRMQQLIDQHRALLAAIDAGEADRADRLMAEHLSALPVELPKIEAGHPELFG